MVDDLLELARQLTESGATRPRQIQLRRAISTAYYAAFHAFCRVCADVLVGDKPWEDYTPIYRLVEHGAFRRTDTTAPLSTQARKALTLMVVLQERRHEVDYDPRPLRLTRKSTLQAIDDARQIVADLRALPPPEQIRLAVHLVARGRRR